MLTPLKIIIKFSIFPTIFTIINVYLKLTTQLISESINPFLLLALSWLIFVTAVIYTKYPKATKERRYEVLSPLLVIQIIISIASFFSLVIMS